MEKGLWKLMSCFQGIVIQEDNGKPEDPDYKPLEGILMDIIKEIFSVDPVTGFPKGDIQYYLSKDGNPDVKRWIENNLLVPRVSSGQSTPEGVTDDMIVEMSRQSGESVADYQQRLMSIYDECQQNIAVAQEPQSD